MANNDYPTAQIHTAPRFSLIWIIPLTAAIIAGWLTFKHYSERGSIITITFDKASGIEAKKTPIRYKDIQVGKVKKLSLTSDLQKVLVTAEIFPEMAENLSGDTRFWVERPRLTFQGISGLDTLLSGVHIGIDPGEKSEARDHYEGLATAPIITTGEKGRSIILNSTNLGSLNIGSPVYYHKINVGEVTSYELNDHNGSVDISIYVHAPYDKKIKTNSRFWNASGLEMELSSSGVNARMESLASLLIGGIAFDTPIDKLGYDLDGETSYKLYESYKLANDDTQRLEKIFYVMYFDDSLHGLNPDSLIEYSGVKVGKVESIVLEKNNKNNQVKTLVKVSLFIDKFSEKKQRTDAERTLQNLVSNGLKAQLTVDSLITGAQYISLIMPKKPLAKQEIKQVFALLPTDANEPAIFPTTGSLTSLLNFDASEITDELSKAISSVTTLLNSKDVKKTLKGIASTSESISKITQELQKKGFSGELVKTLASAQKTVDDISLLLVDTRRAINVLQKDGSQTLRTITNVSNKLQKDASKTLNTLSNVSNKLQKDLKITLKNVDQGIKSTLHEDSALQYRLQQLINDLGEASKSFSILADTLQRKPNSVIFGK
ncbi:MAG TPA: MCE family protein [Leucothrix mucor]|nr:MCE family protein [Leucothrix mucor]